MNKIEAIAATSAKIVSAVESTSVDFTGATHNGLVEFSASVEINDSESLVMRVLVPESVVNSAIELDNIDWPQYIVDARFEVEA